jgi:hypothetical protein
MTQFIKAADTKLDDYLQRLDKRDATERATGGSRVKNLAEKIAAIRERRERHKDMLAELDQTGESQISLTDPDSRAMAAHTHVAVGYNVQIAVDAKIKLIVEQQVTNQVVDMGLLAQTAEPAKEVLGVERKSGNGSTLVSIVGSWVRRMAFDRACSFPPAHRAASATRAHRRDF